MFRHPSAATVCPCFVTLLLSLVMTGFFSTTALGTSTDILFDAALSFDTGLNSDCVAIGDLNGDGRLDLVTANLDASTVSVLLGNGDGTFGAKTDYETGSAPNFVAIGDLNGDGELDLATANGNSYDVFGVSVLLGNGDGTFGAKTDFVTGNYPQCVAIGDLNGDGKPDLMTANGDLYGSPGNTVSVLLGNGDGTFGINTDFATGPDPLYVAIADLNGDGALDLVTANYGSSSVSVLLGSGDGTLGANTDYIMGHRPSSVVVEDLNGDGKRDIAATGYGPVSGKLSVRLGNGDGTFGVLTTYGPPGGVSVAVADLNVDGKPDVVTAGYYHAGSAASDGYVSVRLGSGDGTFGARTDYGMGSDMCRSVAIGDLNGDGKLDLAAANGGESYSSGTVTVLLGKGDGTFKARTDYLTNFPRCVAIGDLNADGRPDLVTADEGRPYTSPGTVAVLFNNGDGTFVWRSEWGTGGTPFSVAIGDLNGDGKPDLVTANSGIFGAPGGNTVSVLLGNGDGTFGAKTDYGTGNGPLSVAIGDLNGDGKLDLVTADADSGTVSVLIGNGDGTFGAKTDYAAGGSSVAIGDLNSDGKLDLATDGVSVLLGNGDGTFGTKMDYVAGGGSVTIGDLNGDGKPDLVTAGVSVLLGNGDGTFGAKTDFETGNGSRFVGIGDLNGDGKPDIATANANTNTVSVLLGNGNGILEAKMDFGTGSLPNSVAIGDLNGDGKPDLATANQASSTVSVLLHTCAYPSAVGSGSEPRLARLHAPAPNPTHSATTIAFELSASERVTLGIYDIAGRLVRVLSSGTKYLAGRHALSWDGKSGTGQKVASGVYFVRFQAGEQRGMQKILMSR